MKLSKTKLKQIIKEEIQELESSMQAEERPFEERVRDLHSNISSAAEETYTGFDDDDLKTFEKLMELAGHAIPEEDY
tara:strand:+ start:349 stop:579 length:231 start_codon:yes stop_codon:yes gene_type:complete